MTIYTERVAYLRECREKAERRVADAERGAEAARAERSRIEGLIKELAEAKLAERSRIEGRRPIEPAMPECGGPTVIVFAKHRGTAHYAAIRPGKHLWIITQTPNAKHQRPAMGWGILLSFIGSENWDSIGLLTNALPLAHTDPDTVDALTTEHTGYAWLDSEGDRWEYRDGKWIWQDISVSGSRKWHTTTGIEPDTEGAPYTRVAPVVESRDRIVAEDGYKEWTL